MSFWCLQFFQKRNLRHFEINWPLEIVKSAKINLQLIIRSELNRFFFEKIENYECPLFSRSKGGKLLNSSWITCLRFITLSLPPPLQGGKGKKFSTLEAVHKVRQNFFIFLTPSSPMSALFYTYLSLSFPQFRTHSPLKSADVLYGRPLRILNRSKSRISVKLSQSIPIRLAFDGRTWKSPFLTSSTALPAPEQIIKLDDFL